MKKSIKRLKKPAKLKARKSKQKSFISDMQKIADKMNIASENMLKAALTISNAGGFYSSGSQTLGANVIKLVDKLQDFVDVVIPSYEEREITLARLKKIMDGR